MTGIQVLLGWSAQGLRVLQNSHTQFTLITVIGIVFIWSGVAKLRQPMLAAMAIMDFGLLSRVNRSIGSLAGIFELGLGVILVSGRLPLTTTIMAMTMFGAFSLLIARSLRRGKNFACYCFGDSDAKLSRLTLFRSVALMLVSATIVWSLLVNPLDSSARTMTQTVLHDMAALSLVGIVFCVAQFLLMLQREREIWRAIGA